MKKSIAVIFSRMIVGGAEKSLLNLLDAIDRDRYQVSLFTYDENSAYLDVLPPEVSVVYTKCASSAQILVSDLRRFRLISVLKGLFFRLMTRISKDAYKKFSYNIRCLPRFEDCFDCVISYKLNYEDTATALWRIDAPKKCVVAHSSVGTPDEPRSCYIDVASKRFDRVFCVSEGLAENIRKICPRNAHIVQVLHNILPIRQIQTMANASLSCPMQHPAIVTVGRLSEEKGQAMIPAAVRQLVDCGYDIHWYLIGDGPLRAEVQRQIQKNDVADYVVLLGMQQNPYPYIKQCDIYAQTSFSEGYCTTTMEAKVLQKPVVTTDAPGMREQFVSGENGLIVDAMTPEALSEGIRTLLDHPELRQKFADALEKEAFDNAKELQKLYDFIEENNE